MMRITDSDSRIQCTTVRILANRLAPIMRNRFSSHSKRKSFIHILYIYNMIESMDTGFNLAILPLLNKPVLCYICLVML